jgi:hypothetical protein
MAMQEDRYDTLDDETLSRHLSEQAERRRGHLVIEQYSGHWIAETYQTDGLSSGRSVTLGAQDLTRPTRGDVRPVAEVGGQSVVDAR